MAAGFPFLRSTAARRLGGWLFVIGQLTCTVPLPAMPPLRIAPIGDSITQGSGAHQSYRYRLWKKLLDAGASFDLVGSIDYNDGSSSYYEPYLGQAFDRDHEGHAFYQSGQVLQWLPFWMNQSARPYTLDIALLHIGTNDVFVGLGASSTVTNIHGIIDTLRTKNPQVTVLIAKLIPVYNTNYPGGQDTRINAINAQIDGIAAAKSTTTSRVLVVDQNTGFNPNPGVFPTWGGDTTDGVHPSPSGEEKMAQRWFEVLQPLILPPSLSAVTIVSDHATPTLARAGNTLTLRFTASEPLQTPTVTIAGRVATVANPSGNQWTGTVLVAASDPQGTAAFSIVYQDLSSSSGPTVTATTDASTVTVDTVAPAIVVPGDQTAEATGLAGAVVAYPTATASDAVTVSPAIAYSQGSGTTFPLGTTTVTVTATDGAGNAGIATFTVQVQDTTAPGVMIVTPPTNATFLTTSAALELAGTAADLLAVAQVTWSSDRGGNGVAGGTGTWTASAVPLQFGANVITVTALDAAGNAGSAMLSVTRQTLYEGWVVETGIAGADSGPMGDFDADGLRNLLEFAFGTDPKSGHPGVLEILGGSIAQRGGPTLLGADSGLFGGNPSVVYARRKDRVAAGLAYTVEFSADLATWVPATETATLIAEDGVLEAMAVPCPASLGDGSICFFRVAITTQ